jgi:hypothetical protein
MLAKQDFDTLAKIKFLRLKIMCLWLSYKKKYGKKIASLKSLKKEVGSGVGSGSAPAPKSN